MNNLPNIAFDPLVSMALIYVVGFLVFLAALLAGFSKLKSFILRVLAGLFLILALLNPQTVEEEREPLPDQLLVIVDDSESARLGDRENIVKTVLADLNKELSAKDNLEITTVRTEDHVDGTQLISTLIEQLSNMPQNRLAGVIAITDGQVHDVPNSTDGLLPENVPMHSLIIDDENGRDRRISAIVAPKFGLVGEEAIFEIRIDDPGFEGDRAAILVRVNGELIYREPKIIGRNIRVPVKIQNRGTNTIELNVAPAPDELTLKNNIFVSEISGIRDSMQVLLITGEPHRGGRAWRNLLKSDPAVEMVHFTILTIPFVKEKVAATSELSLIQFPTQQLFEEKLEDFDLIIFDQFTRRTTPGQTGRSRPLIPPYYIQNIANYVEDGGALLVATGPGFASENSLYRTALAGVLPARPTGDISEFAFTPQLTDKGRRHPVTSSFSGNEDQNWGQWFRIIDSEVISGHVLMEGPDEQPLLVMEKVGDGRVGMLLSDQAWLWSRGYDGGGPYSELFRRMAHWLLGEPDLEAEKLTAQISGEQLIVERSTLSEKADRVRVRRPDGTSEILSLTEIQEGQYRGAGTTAGQGAYFLESGDVSTVTAIGSLNPKEYSDLSTTIDRLEPLAESSGGQIIDLSVTNKIPEIRQVASDKTAFGNGWIGIRDNNQFITRNSRRTPLAPGWLFFLLSITALALAWRREGR